MSYYEPEHNLHLYCKITEYINYTVAVCSMYFETSNVSVMIIAF